MCWLIGNKKGKPLCNFRPEVVAAVDVYDSAEAESVPHVRLKLNFGDRKSSDEFLEPLSKLEDTNWLERDSRCRFYPEASPGKLKRYLADAVREEIPDTSPEKLYRISRVGVHDINGEKVFCTGGGLIRPFAENRDRPVIELKPMPLKLDIDPDLAETEAAAEILELVGLSPDALRVILTHSLLYIMRDVYKAAWKAPCCCIFLYGKTGSKKTTIASHLTQVYNRSKGIESPPRLNASIAAAVGILKENIDCVVVPDDLFPADSNQVKGQQEETLIEITRFIGDGTLPARISEQAIDDAAELIDDLFDVETAGVVAGVVEGGGTEITA